MTYQRPGVFINERLLPAPITSFGTANAAGAALGAFAQGPNTVTLVTSWYDFVKQFGGYNALYPATLGVGLYFQNGGSELYVKRVLHTGDTTPENNAVSASVAVPKATGSGSVGTITAKNIGADSNNLRVQLTNSTRANYFNLTVYKETVAGTASNVSNDIVLEQFNDVVFNDITSSDYAPTVVGYSSKQITLTVTDNINAPSTNVLPLTGGDNGIAPVVGDYTGAVADFSGIDRPLVVFAPGITEVMASEADSAEIQNALIEWAGLNNGFAVLDTPSALPVSSALSYSAGLTKSSNAAVYYPNVFISDPLGRSSAALRRVGPAGAIAGLYIQTDKQTGPFKAPAGVYATVRGAVALEKAFTSAELDSLNSSAAPLNAIRNLPGAGIVSMGARTLMQDGTANKYVNMRRSLIYIKKSLNDLSQFALFENNDERLWARLRTVLGGFLNDYRNQGGLRGETPAAAFYVKVDAENNSNDSIASGEVHIEIGVALQYPAEFVVINLSQKTAQ